MTQAEIAELNSFSKSKVNYWVSKFLKNGLIRVQSSGKPVFYQLTAFGLKILTRSEIGWKPPVVMEDYAVKFVLRKGHGLISWEKLGKPRNWEKLGILVGGCRVEKTTQHIIIHTGQLSGFDPEHLLFEAGQIVGSVKDFLQTHGVELGPIGIPLHKPIFRFYTPEAEALNETLGTIYTKNGSIDHSPPDAIPHVEWNYETAKNYLEMPNRIRNIEKNQEAVMDSLLVFAKGMEEHMTLIHGIQNVVYRLKEVVESLREIIVRLHEHDVNVKKGN